MIKNCRMLVGLLFFLFGLISVVEAKEMSRSQQAEYQKAVSLSQGGKYDSAIRILLKLSKKVPMSAKVFEVLGAAYSAVQNVRDAIESLKKALALDPTLSEAQIILTLIYDQTDDPENWPDQANLLEELITKFPDDGYYQYLLGRTYIKLGRHADSIAPLKKTIDYYERKLRMEGVAYSEAYYNANKDLGDAYNLSGNYREAIERFNIAKPHFLKSEEFFHNFGVAYGRLKEYEKATDALKKAIGLNPMWAESHCTIGSIFLNWNKPREAREHLEEALTINQSFTKAREELNYLESRYPA